MYLRKDRRKGGRTYLSITESYRDGARTRTRHVESIGYVDELVTEDCPDPVAFWQAEVGRRNAFAKEAQAPVIVKLKPGRKIDKRCEGRLEVGAAVPSAYFHRDLGIGDFFERRRTSRRCAYDPCRILELLVFDRIAHPSSKASAWEVAVTRSPAVCTVSAHLSSMPCPSG